MILLKYQPALCTLTSNACDSSLSCPVVLLTYETLKLKTPPSFLSFWDPMMPPELVLSIFKVFWPLVEALSEKNKDYSWWSPLSHFSL